MRYWFCVPCRPWSSGNPIADRVDERTFDIARQAEGIVGTARVMCARRWIVAWAALLALNAHAQTDWIDEFPPPTDVAHAAFEELKVTAISAKLDLASDDDSIAVNLVGSFVVLKQIMLLKYNAEPAMSKEREGKLRKLVATYEEAELAIGKGASGRRGYITRGPPTGLGCRDLDCYRRWFLQHVNANSGRAEYRERFLKRLFPCGDRAKEFNDLRQKHATTVPYMPSPALTLKIEPEIAGIAPAGCSTMGGDANGNGLCDDWEKPLAAVTAKEVRKAKDGGLRVTLAQGGVQPGTSVRFRVVRADKLTPDADRIPMWCGTAEIKGPEAELHAIVAQGDELKVDPTHPYLIVEAVGRPSDGAARCELPLVTWLQSQLDSGPEGLHGPYPRADVAALSTARFALDMTNSYECGFLIGRNMFSKDRGYYTTPPMCGTSDDEFSQDDYLRTHRKAFEASCEDPLHYALAGSVHTHPKSPVAAIDERNDYFSMKDFDGSVEQKHNDQNFEKIYMVSKRSRCVESFEPAGSDRVFTFAERHIKSVAGQVPAFAKLYLDYVGRMTTIKCY